MPLHGGQRLPGDLGDLFVGEPGEVLELDDARLPGIERGEAFEGVVDGQHIGIERIGDGGFEPFGHHPAGRVLPARMVDENAAHRLGRDGEEVRAVGEVGALPGQPDPGLVHHGRRLQGVARALGAELLLGDGPQAFVNGGEERVGGASGLPLREQRGDVGFGSPGHVTQPTPRTPFRASSPEPMPHTRPMTTDRWSRVNELFHQALELHDGAREDFLARACGDDATLRAEVDSLLAAHGQASGGFLETPLLEERPLREVGPWRVVRELGRGGMGTVFLAERADGAFRMTAAVKVLRRGLDSEPLLARFREERQILASLDHPHIARLLDGGTLPDGRPWLAMEYVEGVTLLEACATRDRHARLQLFRQLTDAVSWAHRNLVVHRDLKPGNVLVTPAGQLRLLDFGIARVLDADRPDTTGPQLLTPAYASPEQVRGERVTTAADVWALGVMLYELLSGRRPFQGAGQTLAQAIVASEPALPGLGAELDGICLTALQKRPEDRYPSVDALADDLARLESGLPVRARPATWAYRLQKFLRRHRLAVSAAALVLASLSTAVVVTVRQAREARDARARAEDLVDFMLGDLRQKLEPSSRLDVLEDVSRAVQAYLDSVPREAQSPTRRARTLQQLATVKLAQAKGDEAAPLIAASREALDGQPGSVEVDVLRGAAANLEGQLREARGELEQAQRAFTEAGTSLDAAARQTDDAHVWVLAIDANNDRGRVQFSTGALADALASHERAAALLASHSFEHENREVVFLRAKTTMYVGRALEAQGRLDDAERAFRENLLLSRRLHGDFPEDHELEDNLAVALNDLGRVLRNRGNAAEAEPLAEEAVGFSTAALARDPENSIRIDGLSASHAFLGRAREALGKLDAALPEFEADVALSERLLEKEPDNAFVQAALADGLTNVGRAQRKRGQLDAAGKAHARALQLREALAQKDPSFGFDVAVSKLELGRVQRLSRQDPVPAFEAARALLEPLATADDASAKQQSTWAQVLLELGRREEAKQVVDALQARGALDADLRALWEAR